MSIHSQRPLAASLGNKVHFDEMVVVTFADDEATRHLCESAKVTYCYHPRPCGMSPLGSTGENGGAILNGIEKILSRQGRDKTGGPSERDDWVCVFRAGVYLPEDFRERVWNLRRKLDVRKQYALRNERVCRSQAEYDALTRTNWREVETSRRQPLSNYLSLFSLSHFESFDLLFMESAVLGGQVIGDISDDARQLLPMSCLYLDPFMQDAAERDVLGNGAADRDSMPVNPELGRVLGEAVPSGRKASAVVVGCENGTMAGLLAERVANLYVVDSQRVSCVSADDLEELDRSLRWSHLAASLRQHQNIALVGRPEDDPRRPWDGATVEADEAMAEVLFIGVEPTYEFLIDGLPRWLRLLKPGGVICGTHYGLPAFPQTTPAIGLLLGTPDLSDEEGIWSLRLTLEKRRQIGELTTQNLEAASVEEASCGVALFIFDQEDSDRAMTALHVLRRVWSGPVCLVKWGAEEPALRIACALKQASYVQARDLARPSQMGMMPAASCVNRDVARLVSLEQSPFARTLWVTPDDRIPHAADWLDRLNDDTSLVIGEEATTERLGTFAHLRDTAATRALAEHYRSSPMSPDRSAAEVLLEEFLRLPAARISGGQFSESLSNGVDAAEVVKLFRPLVRVPQSAVLITAVTPEDIDALRHNWNALQWPERTRRIVYLHEIEMDTPAEYFPDGCEVRPLVPAVLKEFPNEPHWTWAILSAALDESATALVYVDPYLKASPGAQLFCDRRCAEAPYISPGWTFLPLSKGARKIAKIGPPASLFAAAWLRGALAKFRQQDTEQSFEVFLHDLAIAEGKPAPVIDVMACGWNG